MNRERWLGLFLALVGVVGFSFSLPWTQLALESFDPYLTAFGRAAIAGLLAGAVLLAARVRFPGRAYLRPLLITALGAVFGWPILIALALERTSSAHAAVIAAVMPLVTGILAVLRTQERVSKRFWVASVAGLGLLTWFTITRPGAAEFDPLADLLLIFAVFFSSWCYVEGAVLTKTFPGWQVISWVLVISLPATLIGSSLLIANGAIAFPPTGNALVGMAGISLVSMFLGFFAWYKGLAMAGITLGSQVQQLQAPLTVLWAAVLLGQPLAAEAILVLIGLLIAVGVAVSSRQVAQKSQ